MEKSNSQPSSSKRKKCSSYQKDEDRLSSLPEPLIHLIYSFLDIRQIGQTSIISRNWKYIWTRMPYLKFIWKMSSSWDDLNTVMKRCHFHYFVDRFLLLRADSDIQKFQIDCDKWWDPVHIHTWVSVAVKRNLQELYIDITPEKDIQMVRFPTSLFTCESLKVMQLKFSSEPPQVFLSLPRIISLPSLKTLEFSSVMFIEELSRLISNCPVLKSLRLIMCSFQESTTLNISALQLEDLVIDNWYHCDEFVFKLNTPSLTSFKCEDFMPNNYVVENVSSLVKADIGMVVDYDIEIKGFELYLEKRAEFGQHVIKILLELCSVKSLTLSSWSLQFLSEALQEIEQHFHLFRNLRSLAVTAYCNSPCLRTITHLLKSLPDLETLIVHIDEEFCPSVQEGESWAMEEASSDKHDKCWESELLSEQLFKNVKRVEIMRFEGCEIEKEFVKFLLKNCVVLERLVINNVEVSSIDREKRLREFNQDIAAFPRASPCVAICFICQVKRKQ